MPRDRPETEAEARAQREAPEPEPASGHSAARQPSGDPAPALVSAWAAMPEWDDDEDAPVMWRADAGAGECPECGRPAVAEPGRTLVCCPSCEWWDDYPEVVIWRERQATAADTPAKTGPDPVEMDQVAEECAVGLDEIGHARELLNGIPRDDRWRENAVRALHKLKPLEQRYSSARSFADLAEAHEAATKLLGDDDTIGELAGVLQYADRLARREDRGARGGSVWPWQHGDVIDGEVIDGEIVDGEIVRAAGLAAPEPVAGYSSADPDWRSHMSPAAVTAWDQIGALELAPDYLASWASAGHPPCQQCGTGGNLNPPPAVAQVRYNDLRNWNLCATHTARMLTPMIGVRVQVLRWYDAGARVASPAITNGSPR